ncbi:MAG TPA: MlaD family protein [Verrucomicrobiae bacterium]|nr:MlaD family protein [Verrucomicrobiae bacterium]
MEQKRLQTKVGLFVFIGLALLALLVIQFSKGASLFRRTFELRMQAVNAGGLKPRASVQLAGVEVGTVSDIQLAPSGTNVTIVLDIYKGVQIFHDARFVIEQSGFLGDRYVSIVPANNELPLLTNNAVVNCEEPFNLQDMARSAAGFITRIDATAKKLDASVTDLRRTVLSEETLNNFAVTMHNMRTVSEQAIGTMNDVNDFIAMNTNQVGFAVSNVLFFSEQLTRLANSANTLLVTNTPEINATLANIRSSTETLKNMVDELQSGRGLAGTMLQNQELATNVQAIANNLSVATSNLNRLGLWGFLWHKESEPEPATTSPSTEPLLTPRQAGHQP